MKTIATPPLGSLVRSLPALAWMAVIFRLSALPGSHVPGRYAALAHFATYAVLGALLTLPLRHQPEPGRTVAAATVLASAYGVTDELHQSFVPMRTPDVSDWGVDTLGAYVGALAAVLLTGLVRRRRARAPSRQ